jgi:hypothetical protein
MGWPWPGKYDVEDLTRLLVVKNHV